MAQSASVESLQTFQDKVFARHVLFDLPFPVIPTFLVVAMISWLLHGKVPGLWILLWALFASVTTVVRVLFDRHMRKQVSADKGYATALLGFALLSLPTGAISGAFACMYYDVNQPMTMVILSTYMTIVVVGGVVPTSVYLPAFYLLVLPAHGPYLLLLMQDDRMESWVLVGLNVLFLMVTLRYAHAANQMHRDSVRLRYEKQRLIEDLGERSAAAQSAVNTKSLFLAGVSHDLKQPIRAMSLYLGALQHTLPQERALVMEKVGPKMEKALSELHGQVTRLLELSRLESGSLELHMEQVVLATLFADLHALFEGQAHTKGLRLHFANLKRCQHTTVWADKKMLQSILQNLISNAIKYTARGAVYVGIRQRQGELGKMQLCIEVRDSGRGIALVQQAHLFEPYRSFDDRNVEESHGLGLAIAKAQANYWGPVLC